MHILYILRVSSKLRINGYLYKSYSQTGICKGEAMKNKIDISQLIQNFDNEVDSKVDWLNLHISLMFNEIHEIQNTIYIFETVEKE